MAKLGNQMKLAFLKGMEAVGKGASNLASNAHLKVSEMNLETRRREILSEFPLRAHDLWQKGVELPEPLGGMLSELNDLDERLSVLRAQRYAKVEEREAGKATPTEASEEATNGEAPTDESADAQPEADDNAPCECAPCDAAEASEAPATEEATNAAPEAQPSADAQAPDENQDEQA